MEVKLVVVEGKPRGREIPLPSTIFVIGRHAQCHLRPHSQLVSKYHCAIARWAGKVVVRDLKSSNGTFVNEQPIRGEVAVRNGDRLRVGNLVFAFKISAAETARTPVQIVNEGEVRWLMESPSDSFVLDPNCDTHICELAAELFEDSDTPSDGAKLAPGAGRGSADTTGSSRLSAGQYLRDYFRHRKP